MKLRMKKLAICLLLVTAAATPAFAQLRLTITEGVTDPIPIAVVPFARAEYLIEIDGFSPLVVRGEP